MSPLRFASVDMRILDVYSLSPVPLDISDVVVDIRE